MEEKLGSDIIDNWKKPIQLLKPIDLFNDKLDYRCSSFADVIRLNESMLNVIEKYTFLDPNRAHGELEKFKQNFEILQTCLGEIDGTFYSLSNGSKLKQYRDELEDINKRFLNLHMNHDVCYGPRGNKWQSPCLSHTLTLNNSRAKNIQSKYGCLLSTDGYTTGIHKWTLKLHERISTCMVGVAPSTVSKGEARNNYNTNGYYMDLNSGLLYSGPPFSHSGKAFSTAIPSGATVIITLNCRDGSLSYTYNNNTQLAYTGIPITQKLFLAWDNDTTQGADIELL